MCIKPKPSLCICLSQALHALWPYPALHARLALLLSNRAAALLSQGKPLRCGSLGLKTALLLGGACMHACLACICEPLLPCRPS